MTKLPELIVLCGLPGAGKSTYARQYVLDHPETKVLSSDGIRKELYGDESIQGNPADVFDLMKRRAAEYLNNGIDVIYDATGMMRMHRGEIVSYVPESVPKKCVVVWASIEECIERDNHRKRKVGKDIIEMLAKTFESPCYEEGFTEISVIMPKDFDSDEYEEKYLESMKIWQDQPKGQNVISWMKYGLKDRQAVG